MKTSRTIFSALLGLALLAAIIGGVYAALAWAGGVLTQFATPAALAALAALVAAWLVARTAGRARQRRAAERLHAERVATYQLFADVWAAVVAGAAENLDGERRALDRLLALYGSPAVLKAHLALRALERERGPADPALRLELGRALLAIRRDLGLETAGLGAEDLQRLIEAAPRLPPGQTPAVLRDIRPRVSLGPDS
jgi:hypothetical protein